MSKIAQYLQEHIQGEVVTSPATLAAMSNDASALTITPEMVIYPRLTNDVRKVARFAWQLAEKGHVLPLTARGGGSDQTGAAIGKGVILAFPAHMNKIFEFDEKQKLIRVQPGVNAATLDRALRLQGMAIPTLPVSAHYSTIGGAVANNASGPMSGQYGDISEWVHQLEIVLANGDMLQTQRLSKRELNKKKGLQTLEGEIYRSVDNLITDSQQIVDEKLGGDTRDNVGYNSLSQVKRGDGSFDLTPLFVGSQGTLGVISELILKTDFVSAYVGVAVAAFTSRDVARDTLDQLRKLNPSMLEYFDGALFDVAASRGRQYDVCKSLDGLTAAVVVIGFDDFGDTARARKLKRVKKLLSTVECQVVSANGDDAPALLAIREVTSFGLSPTEKDTSAPALFDGAYVPRERFEDFHGAVSELAKKHAVTLPLHSRALEDIYYARPIMHLKKVGDKQKVFKLIDEYATIVDAHGGHLIAESGEGRLKARAAYRTLDDDVVALFAAVKDIFDPFSIMNPEVKQVIEPKDLAAQLGSSDGTSAFSPYSLYR